MRCLYERFLDIKKLFIELFIKFYKFLINTKIINDKYLLIKLYYTSIFINYNI